MRQRWAFLSTTMLCHNILELVRIRGMNAGMDSLREALAVLVKRTKGRGGVSEYQSSEPTLRTMDLRTSLLRD